MLSCCLTQSMIASAHRDRCRSVDDSGRTALNDLRSAIRRASPGTRSPLRWPPARPRQRRGLRWLRTAGVVAFLLLVASGCNLKSWAQKSDVLIGSGAVNPAYLDDPQFAAILAEQFGSLSPENELKWSFNEPQQG